MAFDNGGMRFGPRLVEAPYLVHFGTLKKGNVIMPSDSGTLSIPSKQKPLVVDLDGTLVRSDLLIESAFAHLGNNPLRVFGLLLAIWRGKAVRSEEHTSELQSLRHLVC